MRESGGVVEFKEVKVGGSERMIYVRTGRPKLTKKSAAHRLSQPDVKIPLES